MKRCHSFIFKFLNFYMVAISMTTVFTLSGCIEEYEADITEEDTNMLVVEGAICSSRLNQFYLSRTQAINSLSVPKVVKGAIVSVRGTDGSEYKTQGTDGCYSCQLDDLAPDVEYYLHIEADGEVYESEPQKPLPTEQIAEVSAVQYTPVSNIDVLVTPAAPFDSDKANYYTWSYDETWEVWPEYRTFIFFDVETLSCIYKPNQFPERGWKDAKGSTYVVGESQKYEGQHIQKLKLYDIDRGNERVYYKYSAIVHQRAISKAEYEYELARRQASSEMGGLFTPQPSALPTNIHCLTSDKHVIGYVGCSLNVSDYRFFIDAVDYKIDHPIGEDKRTWVDDCDESICCKMVAREMYLCEWQDDRMIPGGTLRTAWATALMLDVRLRGAYEKKPDFWVE